MNAEVFAKPVDKVKLPLGIEVRSGNDIETEDRNDFQFSVSSNHSHHDVSSLHWFL